MSDWKYLEGVRVKLPVPPQIHPMYASDSSYGFNGMFRFWLDGKPLRCIASDGEGWQHVSVSVEGDRRVPSWDLMCQVKDLFWNDEDWVVQFHPAKSEYVNNHPGCLHLWKPTGQSFPTPDSRLVGIK